MPEDTPLDPVSSARVLALTTQIVSAHVRRNAVPAAELPDLIRAVHRAIDGLGQAPAPAVPPRPEPAVPVRRSVHRDAITCLECGLRFKTLKRHLATDHGMTPEAYRARWDLPADYPIVAPDYAAARSGMAKRIGLGRKRTPQAEAPEEGAEEQEAPVPGPEPEPAREAAPDAPDGEAAPAPKRRGRRKAGAEPSAE